MIEWELKAEKISPRDRKLNIVNDNPHYTRPPTLTFIPFTDEGAILLYHGRVHTLQIDRDGNLRINL